MEDYNNDITQDKCLIHVRTLEDQIALLYVEIVVCKLEFYGITEWVMDI